MKQKLQKYILWFKEISAKDVPLVGGKNLANPESSEKIKKIIKTPVKAI
jgi:phosphoenolpyruvate synthase/pyruvate phosphate dikinase